MTEGTYEADHFELAVCIYRPSGLGPCPPVFLPPPEKGVSDHDLPAAPHGGGVDCRMDGSQPWERAVRPDGAAGVPGCRGVALGRDRALAGRKKVTAHREALTHTSWNILSKDGTILAAAGGRAGMLPQNGGPCPEKAVEYFLEFIYR